MFAWHNAKIRECQAVYRRWAEHAARSDGEIDMLKIRMAEWVERSEGSRYEKLYKELKNRPHHLEAHANRQAKIINWMSAHLADLYPSILEKAKEATRYDST